MAGQSVDGMREGNGGHGGYLLSSQLLEDNEDRLADDGENGYGGDEEDDPDAQHDPNSAVNLQSYLTDFVRSFSGQPYFQSGFLPHLNVQEKQVLTMVGIQV